MTSRESVAHTWAMLLAIIIMLTAQSVAIKQDKLMTLLNNYIENQDIQVFCEDFESETKVRCKEDITAEEESDFKLVIRSQNKAEIITYLNSRLLEHPEELELQLRDCNRLIKHSQEYSDPLDFIDELQELLLKRGWELKINLKSAQKSEKHIRKIATLNTCNLAAIGSLLGKVRPRGISAQTIAEQAINIAANQLHKLRDNTIGGDMDRIKRETREEVEAHKAKKNYIETRERNIQILRRECHIQNKLESCKKLEVEQRTQIMDQLGVYALRFAEAVPNLRDFMHAAAGVKESMMMFSMTYSFETLSVMILFFIEYFFVTLSVAIVILAFFRPDIKNLVSFGLTVAGFGVIPAMHLARVALVKISSRLKGVALALAMAYTLISYNTGGLTGSHAICLVYGTIVCCYLITDKERGIAQVITLFLPCICYIAANEVDYDYFNTQVIDKVRHAGEGWFPKGTFSILDYLSSDLSWFTLGAFVSLMTITNLASMCDYIGRDTYVDVANNKSGKNRMNTFIAKNPTIGQFFGSIWNEGSISLIICLLVPALITWKNFHHVLIVTGASAVVSACVYYYMYHDDFIKEGETTGALPDRIIESMEIIIGMAPKNRILPKFQGHAAFCLALAAAFMTAHFTSEMYATSIVALLVGWYTYRQVKSLLIHVGTAFIMVNMLSGSLIHLVTGLACLIVGVNRKIRFDMKIFGMGHTMERVEA